MEYVESKQKRNNVDGTALEWKKKREFKRL